MRNRLGCQPPATPRLLANPPHGGLLCPGMRGLFLLVVLFLIFTVWLVRRAQQARKFAQSRSNQASISPTPVAQQQMQRRRWPKIFLPIGFLVFILIVFTGRSLPSAVFGFTVLVVLWSFAFLMTGSSRTPPLPSPAVGRRQSNFTSDPLPNPAPQKAIEQLIKLAKNGNPEAQLQLAGLYDNGSEVPQDHALAFTWCQKAADQGLAQAQYWIGKKYLKGVGTACDKKRAIQYLQMAAGQGLRQAQDDLLRISL